MRKPPPSLADAIRSDLRPVRPLLPPGVRAAIVALVALLSGAALIAALDWRNDLAQLPMARFAVHVALRLLVAVALLWVALREGVPAGTVPRIMANLVLAGALLLIALLPLDFASALGASFRLAPTHSVCYLLVLLTAVPAVALVIWLLLRAFALRPIYAFTAAATAAALLAESALFTACHISAVGHGVFVHGAAVVTAAVAGSVVAWVTLSRRYS